MTAAKTRTRAASAKYTAAPAADRVVYDADLSSTPLDQIECGIVFIHAFWAGTSRQTLRRIADSLVRVDPDRRLTFTVCDIDKIDLENRYSEFYGNDITGGNGDILWISGGVIRARHNTSRQCAFDATTRGLLLQCQA